MAREYTNIDIDELSMPEWLSDILDNVEKYLDQVVEEIENLFDIDLELEDVEDDCDDECECESDYEDEDEDKDEDDEWYEDDLSELPEVTSVEFTITLRTDDE
jgi:hypothetical protein